MIPVVNIFAFDLINPFALRAKRLNERNQKFFSGERIDQRTNFMYRLSRRIVSILASQLFPSNQYKNYYFSYTHLRWKIKESQERSSQVADPSH